MVDLGFEIKETVRVEDGVAVEVFQVPGPSLLSETLIQLNVEAVKQMSVRLGVAPSRGSLCRWRTDGYPIDRFGPRVLLPYVVRLKRVYTSGPALVRWFKAIQAIGEEIRSDGGVRKWRKARQKGPPNAQPSVVVSSNGLGHNPSIGALLGLRKA